MISDGSCSVVSLDVFDTILWRRVPRPVDLFELLGARLRRDGRAPEWLTDTSFRRMRVVAEEQARHRNRSHGSEVSLFEIWQEMPLSLFGDAPIEELVRAELELEREFTVVDLDVAEVIDSAAKHDVPVALVSDTYFTGDQLDHLLDRPELALPEDVRVFRSLHHGTDKASGLWQSVLGELECGPEQVVHVGDNEEADHTTPASSGVRTVHYRRIDDDFEPVLDRERLAAELSGDSAERLSPEHGDFGLTSLRAKTLSFAPDHPDRALDTAWRYGASVLGPVLTGFAEWVASRAHHAGNSVVWCPMREGELLSRLVNDAAAARGWNVEAKPVWLSRQVTAVALVDPYDRDSVHEFIRKSYRLTVGQLLAMLNLRPGDVPTLSTALNTLLDHGEIIDRVTDVMTETPHLTNSLAASVTTARERLLRSLRKSGALDSTDLTLVDLGWGGTIQWQLARILRKAQVDVAVSGLYVVTDERSTRLHQEGLRAEGYLGQAGNPHKVVEALRRSPEVVEQSVSAVCGSLIDFNEDGSPVLGASAGSDKQDGERRAVQDGVGAFQRQWNRYVANADGHWPTLTDTARAPLATVLTSALRSPTEAEAGVFGNWEHDDNFGSSVVTRILPEDLRPAVPYLSPNDLDDLHMRDAFWPALIAASDPRLAAAANARANGLIDPSAFDPSGEQSETRLRFRTGDDEWHDGPCKRVRINHNGLSFARLGFHARDATDVSLAIPGRPAIVRVDWIEATVFTTGDPAPKVLRWEKPEDFAGLTFAECTWLGGNMVQFATPHAALWLPLSVRAGAPVASAQITLAFAVLPQSDFSTRMPAAPTSARLVGRIHEEYRAKGAVGVVAGGARLLVRRLVGRR
ncbi:HAD family hydrolase [Halosaccharopolyspora lacisalsi]|uniref:HAD family hydrolase n=1 Tax=Halosaccharopolyspora lacisalsi TaxID=1000566 RepID=UPI002E28BE2D|nr:HAD family hydrolase [Halosaccharopolyspora lacisalsi]